MVLQHNFAVTGRRSPVMGEGEDMDLISQKLVNWFDMLTWMLRPTCTSLTSLNGAEASHLLDQDERIYPLLCHRLLARAVKLLQEDQNCKLIEPLLIIWSDPKPIQYGEPLTSDQLNAKLSYTIIPGTDEEMRGEFRYSPHNGEILDAGTHSLRVCYIPIDSTRFPLIEQTVSLTVTKLKPEVRWIDDLGEIEIGEELGASQLCAECFNPLDLRTPLMGSFFYSRSAGYVFSKVGKFEITASFFPESWNFTQASLTRYIKVTPRKSTEPTPKIEPTIEWDSREHPPLKVGEELSDLHLHATILEEGILGNFFYSKPYGYVFSKPGDYDIVATFVPQEPFDWRYKQVKRIEAFGAQLRGSKLFSDFDLAQVVNPSNFGLQLGHCEGNRLLYQRKAGGINWNVTYAQRMCSCIEYFAVMWRITKFTTHLFVRSRNNGIRQLGVELIACKWFSVLNGLRIGPNNQQRLNKLAVLIFLQQFYSSRQQPVTQKWVNPFVLVQQMTGLCAIEGRQTCASGTKHPRQHIEPINQFLADKVHIFALTHNRRSSARHCEVVL
jgi:hypothetical protein